MNCRDLEKLSFPEFAVICSGIVSMGLEILAGRVVAPEFGSSIYTWGSIIGISMVALSLGYYKGGKKARYASENKLIRLMAGSSAYILFIMIFGNEIIQLTTNIPLTPIYSSIPSIIVLFGPPTYFLGFISPYSAQLSDKVSKGEASGHFYALGTAGSILGAFGTTFLLIPFLDVQYVYVFFAVIAVLPLACRRNSKVFYLPFLVLFASFLVIQNPVQPSNNVYTDETPYQSLRVTKNDGVVTMFLDGQPQSAKYVNSSETPWDYPNYFYIPYLLKDDIDKALFIGGGGFVGPQQFAENGVETDAVELDPGVVKASEMYFNLSEDENLSVFVDDGREFLQNSDEEYDVIVVDAYKKDKVPFHLTTREFFSLGYDHLSEEGVIVSNIISRPSGKGSEFSKSYYKTMNSVFPTTYYFKTREENYIQNLEIIGYKGERINKSELSKRDEEFEIRNLSEEINFLYDIDVSDSDILTDSYAPVDKLLSPLAGRKYVVE